MNFVVIDLNQPVSKEQRELVKKYFSGYIPHVVILDRSGRVLYNRSGEKDEGEISAILEKALRTGEPSSH